MNADVAELLFDTFVSGAGKAKELYKPLVAFDECDKRLQRAYGRSGSPPILSALRVRHLQ